MAGRGYGKTRMATEWLRGRVLSGYRRIAIIGRTPADVRDICIEGESGILNCTPKEDRPLYEPTKRRLTWKNGAVALAFSSHEPDHLRGVQFDTAICDELASWVYPRETWDNLMFGLRLGDNPQVMITTTPKPMGLLKEIMKANTTVLTKGSSYENQDNLAPQFFDQILEKYENTRVGRQEIYAELLDEAEGSLWKRDWIETTRRDAAPAELQRIVVAIDPAVTAKKDSDDTGIVVAGIDDERKLWILEDASGRFTPDQWGKIAVKLYKKYMADRIVAEVNNGGLMVEQVLRHVDADIPYKAVHATKGKRTRAEPISALYEQLKVHHVGRLTELEDELCNWKPTDYVSPDRLDALVWACTELLGGGSPQIRWI
tara:strand:- start:1447 stop:2565 length:1119 start_codon:yes stop_codon:yes gene_type:complete